MKFQRLKELFWMFMAEFFLNASLSALIFYLDLPQLVLFSKVTDFDWGIFSLACNRFIEVISGIFNIFESTNMFRIKKKKNRSAHYKIYTINFIYIIFTFEEKKTKNSDNWEFYGNDVTTIHCKNLGKNS